MFFIGVGILLCVAFLCWREYTAYLQRELDELSDFLFFIENMRDKMECYLQSPLSWVGEFSRPSLERLGFLDSLRCDGDLGAAYRACTDKLLIKSDASEVIGELFSRFGEGYLDTERGLIDSTIHKLSIIEGKLKDELKNKSRAAGAMIGAIAIGAVIMII